MFGSTTQSASFLGDSLKLFQRETGGMLEFLGEPIFPGSFFENKDGNE